MSDTLQNRNFLCFCDRTNRKQGVFVLPATAHDYPGVLALQSYGSTGTLDTFFFWADSDGALRYGTEHPDSGSFNQDTDGAGVGGASVTLDGAFDNGKVIDGAKAGATAFKVGSTSASNYNMSLYHDDTDMHLAVNIGDLKITAQGGDVDFSNENLTTTGTINIGADNVNLTLGASGATDAYVYFDGAGNLTFYDSAYGATVTLSTLAGTNLNTPTIVGDATITDGKITWTDAVDETAGTWVFAATTGTDIEVTSSITTGDVLTLTADSMTSGSILKLEATEGTLNGGMYIEAYDNTGTEAVFALKEDGEIEITGAAGSDIITVTAGDLQLDNGKFEVDTTQDITSYVKRNHSSSSDAVVEIEQTHASSTGSVLLIDQNATGNAKGIDISHSGDYAALHIAAGAARTGNVITIPMADQLAETAIDITGAATGTASEGIIHVDVTGVLAGNAIRVDSTGANAATGQLLYLTSSGKQAAATEGIAAKFVDTGAATATSYCVSIASTNNEALHVDTGESLFDEKITCSGGICTKVAITDVHDTTPTDAQCDTAFGTPATVGAGFIGIIDDANGGTNVYLVYSDGASWFFITKGTKCT